MIFELRLNGMISFFKKSLPLHSRPHQPGCLPSLNKPPASSAHFSPMQRPVGAV